MTTGLYRHPPVDPNTGAVSAADDAIMMGQMRHCDVPAPHRKDGCTALMHDHYWIDNGIENSDGTHGITVCPDNPEDSVMKAATLLEALAIPADRRTAVTAEMSRRIVAHIIEAAREK